MTVKKRIKIDPYGRHVTVIITNNVRQESNVIEPGFQAGWGAITHRGESGNPIIILPEKIDYGVIAHEAVHAVNYVFAFCGVHSDRDNDEHFAYHQQWLIYRIIDIYRKIKKDKNAVAKKAPVSSR